MNHRLTRCGIIISLLSAVADSFAQEQDSTAFNLEEFEIRATPSLKPFSAETGAIELTGAVMARMPKLLGNPDPLRVMQTLPQVATNNDISAGISVQGGDYASNFNSADGIPLVNPVHLLGLFSVFNAYHFPRFSLTPSPVSPLGSDFTGAALSATSPERAPGKTSGSAAIGLIAADASVKVPFAGNRGWIAAAGRSSYLSSVFPDILKFGDSKFLYDFSDANIAAGYITSGGALVKGAFFFSNDRMKMIDRTYDSKGRFGWSNTGGNITYTDSASHHNLYISDYSNTFSLTQSSREMSLPSSLLQAGWTGDRKFGKITFGGQVNYRSSGHQYARHNGEPQIITHAVSASIGAVRTRKRGILELEAALRATFYHCGNFNSFHPLPRLALTFNFAPEAKLRITGGYWLQTTHTVKESGTGLPVDYQINATRQFRPTFAEQVSVNLSGTVANSLFSYSMDLYYKHLNRVTEFDGALLNTLNPGYDSLDDLLTGTGRAYGASMTLMRSVGKIRGWIGYNVGKSENRFSRTKQVWCPASHDRLHDFKATLSWDINAHCDVSATYLYASGTPYTQAKYGYIIAGNLICEYFPHNSSRLPDYKRLDFSFNYRFPHHSGSPQHSLNLSFYNLLFNKNVLFRFTDWSPDNGIRQVTNAFSSCIPSISYSLEF